MDTMFLRPWRTPKWLRATTLGLGAVAFATLGSAASARAEDGAGTDLEQKIRQQMQHIRELMEANERALFVLSTGKEAKPKPVDVTLPPPDGTSGGAGGSGSSGGDAGSSGSSASSGSSGSAGSEGSNGGEDAAREIQKLIEGLDQASKGEGGGMIPDELKKLVEMIPT
ncbi:MAG: hypothetical protein H6806_05450 [Planctomycetes bacterium]|nr:hypothetical protein [Planctomycetota bacterium]MCB9826057.1 hypothetical protein [Planctomycetota bacterium]MCB9829187.1 hypothetical protein [Planctomycetota bacterium]